MPILIKGSHPAKLAVYSRLAGMQQ